MYNLYTVNESHKLRPREAVLQEINQSSVVAVIKLSKPREAVNFPSGQFKDMFQESPLACFSTYKIFI